MESNVAQEEGADGKTSGDIINAKDDELNQPKAGEGEVDEALDAGQLSPLTGSYLLIVIAEPYSEQDKERIIQRLTKGLLSWDRDLSHVDLNCELLNLANSSPEGDEAKNGEKLVQWASENLVVEVLIHSQVNTLQQCMKNLLASFTRHRHIIHAGYTFSGNGSWILQDGTFSLNDFLELWDEPDVSRLLSAYKGDISLTLHGAEPGWTEEKLQKQPFSKLCQIYVNPKANDKLSSIHNAGITSFVDYLSKFILPSPLDEILQPSDIVGNIRFSHPTLYVFPGGQGDAALFGVNGFNMLIDGGFSRKACFWNFVRHLDRLDAVLLTRINHNSIGGLGAILDRKKISQVFPQIGHFFGNVVEAGYMGGKGSLFSSDGEMEKGEKEASKKDEPPFENSGDLMISLTVVGQSLLQNLHSLSLKPQLCFREHHIDPINLYHKVGHGKLDLYVLNPAKDSRELKEFLSKWNTTASNKMYVKKCETSGRGHLSFPVLNLVSICALVVWQPTNPKEHITRLLFPGSTPQQKIFEALGKLKHLEFLKFPVCSAKSIAESHRSRMKTERIATEVKSQVSSSKSTVTTTQMTTTSASTGVSKTTGATPKPPSPKVSLPKATKTGQNREKQLLATADMKSDTSSSTGLAVTGEVLLKEKKKETEKKEKETEKPRRGRSETRRIPAAKRVPSSSISRDKEANKKPEKKQQVLKSTEESVSAKPAPAPAKKQVRPTSAAPPKKEAPAPKEPTCPKKTNGVAPPTDRAPVNEPAVKSAPPKKESKFGIGKSIPKATGTNVTAPAPAKDAPKKPPPAAQDSNKAIAKDAPKKITAKPNRTIPQPAAAKPAAETKAQTAKAEAKPKVSEKVDQKAATKRPASASTIPKPAPKTTASSAPKPVTRKIVGGAAAGAAVAGVVAAALSASTETEDSSETKKEKDWEVKTNGVADHPARDSTLNLDSEKYDTNGVHGGSSVAATESGSEMSSLGHISVNDEEFSTSERNEADARTPSSRALTDTDDDNLTPKAQKHQSQGESRYEDEEDEYLVVEKSTTDESASVEHEMIHQKAFASSDRGFAATDSKINAAMSLNKDDVDNASEIVAKPAQAKPKKEPQTILPEGAIDIESEKARQEQQTHEDKFGMVEQITGSVPLSVESKNQGETVQEHHEWLASTESTATSLTKEHEESVIVSKSEQLTATQPLTKVDGTMFGSEDVLEDKQAENAHAEAQAHDDATNEDKSSRQININDPLPSFGLSSDVMEVENEPQEQESVGELSQTHVPVIESGVGTDEGLHHPSASTYEDEVIKSESPDMLVREKITTVQPQEKVVLGSAASRSAAEIDVFEADFKSGALAREAVEVFRSECGVSVAGACSVEGDTARQVDSSDEYFGQDKPTDHLSFENSKNKSAFATEHADDDDNSKFPQSSYEGEDEKDHCNPELKDVKNGHDIGPHIKFTEQETIDTKYHEDVIVKGKEFAYDESEKHQFEKEEKGQAETFLEKDSFTDTKNKELEQIPEQKRIQPAEAVFAHPRIPPGTVIRTPDEVADLPVHEVVEAGAYHHEHEDDFTSEDEDHGIEVIPIVKSAVLPEIQEHTSSSLTSSSFQEKADVEIMEKDGDAKGSESEKDLKDNDEKLEPVEKGSGDQIAQDMTKAIEKIDAAISSVIESKAYETSASAQEPILTQQFKQEHKDKPEDDFEYKEEFESENFPLTSGSSVIPVIPALTSTSKTSVVITPSTPPVTLDSRAPHFQMLQEEGKETPKTEAEMDQESSSSQKEKAKEIESKQETASSVDEPSKPSSIGTTAQDFLSQEIRGERKISSDESTASSTSMRTTIISQQESPTSEKTPDFDSSAASAINTNQSTVGSVSQSEKAKFYVGGDSADADDDEAGYFVDTPGSEKVESIAPVPQSQQFGGLHETFVHDNDQDTEEEELGAHVASVVGPGLMAAASTASATVIRHSPVEFSVSPSSAQQTQDMDDDQVDQGYADRESPDSIVNEPLAVKTETVRDIYAATNVDDEKKGTQKDAEKFITSGEEAKANNLADPQTQQIGGDSPQFSSPGAHLSFYSDDRDVKFTTTSEQPSAFGSALSQPQDPTKAESHVVKDEAAIKPTSANAFSQPGSGVAQEKEVGISTTLGGHKSVGGLDSDSDKEIMQKDVKDKNSENYYEDEDDAEDYDPSDSRGMLEKLAQAEYETVTGKKGCTDPAAKDSLQVGFSGKVTTDADRQTQDVISKLLAEQAAEDDTWRKMETIEASDEEEIPHHFTHETHSSEGQPKTTIEQKKSIQKSDDGKSEIETTITTKIIEHPVEVVTFSSDDPAKIQEFKDSIEKHIADSKIGEASSSTTTTETIDQTVPFSQTKTTVTTTSITYPAEMSARYSSEEQSDDDSHEIKIAKDSASKEESGASKLPAFAREEASEFTSVAKESASDFSSSNVVQDEDKLLKEAAESHRSAAMKEETSAASVQESGPGFVKSASTKDEVFSAIEKDVSSEFKSSVTKDDAGGTVSVTSESKTMDFSHSSGRAMTATAEECKFRIGSTSSTLSTDSEDLPIAMALGKDLSETIVAQGSNMSTSYNPFQQDMNIEPSSAAAASAAFDQKAFGSPVTRRFSVQDEDHEKTEEHQKLQRRSSEMAAKSHSTTPFATVKAADEQVVTGQNPFSTSSPSPMEFKQSASSGYPSAHEYETMRADEYEQQQQPFKSTMYGQQLQHPESHYFAAHQPTAQGIDEEANSSGEFSDSQLSTMPPRHLQYPMHQGEGGRQRQGTFDSDNEDPGEEYDDDEHGYDDPDVVTPTTNVNTTLTTPVTSKIMDIENANATGTTVSTSDNANTVDTTSGLAVMKGVMTTSGFSTSSSETSSSAMNFGSTTTIQTQYHSEGQTILASEDDDDDDIVNKWGKPLGLPGILPENGSVATTEPPSAGTETPKMGTGTSTPTPKKVTYQHKKRSLSARPPYTRNLPPIYVDLAYVPHHGNSNYSDSEFFRLVRSRYYVFSGLEPSRQVFEGLLRGKQAWDDKNLEVTIVPTYDTDSLAYWVIDSEDALHEAKIDLAPSASRCTINLQDHDTSCSAYRLEF